MEVWTDKKNDLIGWYQQSKENNVLVIDCDRDRVHNLYAFQVNSIKEVLIVLRHVFPLNWETCRSNPENERAMKCRGSGTWSWYRNRSAYLVFDVDVGCWCEHDCCGHACGLTYEVSIVGSLLIVSEITLFNY